VNEHTKVLAALAASTRPEARSAKHNCAGAVCYRLRPSRLYRADDRALSYICFYRTAPAAHLSSNVPGLLRSSFTSHSFCPRVLCRATCTCHPPTRPAQQGALQCNTGTTRATTGSRTTRAPVCCVGCKLQFQTPYRDPLVQVPALMSACTGPLLYWRVSGEHPTFPSNALAKPSSERRCATSSSLRKPRFSPAELVCGTASASVPTRQGRVVGCNHEGMHAAPLQTPAQPRLIDI
jgi:hypothetical protein